jgi:tetratricopeptide (TPR) repeat protein
MKMIAIKLSKIMLFCSIIVMPQVADAMHPSDIDFYKFFIKGDMLSWEKSLSQLKTNYTQEANTKVLHEIVKAQYGLIGFYIGKSEKSKAMNELELANKNLELLQKLEPLNDVYNAYKTALLGFEIALSPSKATYHGPQRQQLIIKTSQHSGYEPEVTLEYANMRFWAPAIVGGDKKESLIYYRKTIVLLEARKRTKEWYYLWALTAYANAYKALNDSQAAIGVYEKILRFEPNYTWISQELSKTKEALPDLKL